MNVNPSAASIAMQVMQQPSVSGGTAHSSPMHGALALVEAAASVIPPVGMIGTIINTFA